MMDCPQLPDDRQRPAALVRPYSDDYPVYRHSTNHTAGKQTAGDGCESTRQNKRPKKKKKQETERALIVRPPYGATVQREPITTIHMTQSCFLELMFELCSRPPEQAGMLFGPSNDKSLITHFCRDEKGVGTSVKFTIDANFVNEKIRCFKAVDMEMKGIVHSHPTYINRLSSGDLAYLDRLLNNPKNRHEEMIFMPIVCQNRMFPYIVDQSLNVTEPRLQLV